MIKPAPNTHAGPDISDPLAGLFLQHLCSKDFPCVAAHDAAVKENIRIYVAHHMACPADDRAILQFMYSFIDEFHAVTEGFHSAAVIFRGPHTTDEEQFEAMLWQRLQALSDLDATQYSYDRRVSADPSSPQFSYSLKEEAFYVIGLHPASSRKARQFAYPVLIFNPHAQFEKLREENLYHKMQNIVRKRDEAYSGSVNPMLADFGNAPEVIQYSGRLHSSDWKCPLIIRHGQHHTTT
jgi:FPC/CPF motif-containing protein YcgG